eukprot:CAMPEP_0184740346 /NCGR_PEP_ID=MMETSP0315-20130426/3376_1 /TAXON_ID=101924 /ORGANISM="Rhodosorus marinus, Strain UTEX LB 2760" /LENGTH=274 /DNA_ID=CAMNT_0027209985 /DNA_START=90 /DNA_END=914 /DNA_ORIENTATION=+
MAGFVGVISAGGRSGSGRSVCERKSTRRASVRIKVSASAELTELIDVLGDDRVYKRDEAIAKIVENNEPATIPSLIALLGEPKVSLRRAACQTLGKLGDEAVPAIVELLGEDELVPVKRATGVKVLNHVYTQHPELRETIAQERVDLLYKHLTSFDPVTKLAASICLGLIASPGWDKTKGEPIEGNRSVRELLKEYVRTSDDVAILPTVILYLGGCARRLDPDDADEIYRILEETASRPDLDDIIKETILTELAKKDGKDMPSRLDPPAAAMGS